jgi:hypothetical protein
MGNADCKEGLYSGDDLHRAGTQSTVGTSLSMRARGFGNIAAIASQVAGQRLRRDNRSSLEILLVRGKCLARKADISVAYAGSGINREWCLARVLEGYEVAERTVLKGPDQLLQNLARSSQQADVLFADGLPPHLLQKSGLTFFTMPAWVKQRVRLLHDWTAQVDGLRRMTRQETRRILRKYRYSCALSSKAEDYEHFYEQLYVPYITQRFGSTAHTVPRSKFLRECHRGILLRLFHEDRLQGAALLRPVGWTMAVVWSALDTGSGRATPQGATDALDYFSLLFAHKTGCKWLDLGPSRPDLRDGILRYKAKWGAKIVPGLAPQATIALACVSGPRKPYEFLLHHAFLTKTAAGLQSVILVDGRSEVEAVRAQVAAGLSSGIRWFRIVVLDGADRELTDNVRETGANLAVVRVADYPDIISAMNGQ